jgi:hypothetical protein
MIKTITILTISISFCGCTAIKKKKSIINQYIKEPIHEIQINPAPYPFHMIHPYVIWVNGERLVISKKDVILIAEEFNLSLKPPKNTAELHSGNGWLSPLVRMD